MFDVKDRVLVIAAHPDDETIGMGATLHKMTSAGIRARVLFLADGVTSRTIQRETLNSRQSSCFEALAVLGVEESKFLNFPDNKLDTISLLSIIKEIEEFSQEFEPTLVFTHFAHDLNIDHRIAANATLTAFRPTRNSTVRLIAHFEVASSTNWDFSKTSFSPNLFVDTTSNWQFKKRALECYVAELNQYPHARSERAIETLSEFRGNFVGREKAEAFEVTFMRD